MPSTSQAHLRLRLTPTLTLGCIAVLMAVLAALLPRIAIAASPEIGIYTGSERPAGEDDSAAVELGVRFSVSQSGSITAIRFYKSSANTGTHTGTLWTGTGTKLATVTFAGETASGWQVARLTSPVTVTAGSTYVASYHTDKGHYAQQVGAFSNGATLGSGAIKGNRGLYRYGTTGFPTSTWQSSAYYVDALFQAGATATSSPKPTTTTATPKPTTTATATASPSTPTPTSTSSSCARDGAYVWSHLEACGWAGPANTGAQASTCAGGLTANSGATTRTIRITTANTTISCQNITGCLSIEAPNVTVKNVKIACTSGRTGENANGTSVIYVDSGASATIDHVEINGMSGVHACIWHQGTVMSATAVNCYGVNDGVFSWADTGYSSTSGDNFTVKDSYFHDFTAKTANGHIDGYQTEGAGNGIIQHNTYLMTSDSGNDTDSAIAIWNGLKSSHDIAVRSNLIAGGGFAIYAEDYNPSEANPSGGYSVTNVTFTGNVFSTKLYGCVGNWGVWFSRGAPTDGWRRTGNTVLETGANVDAGNPSYAGRICN